MEVTSQSRRRQNRTMRTTNEADRNMDNEIIPGPGGVRQQRQKTKKPLNFNQAMADFQTMFPHIEASVIEAVLRANEGIVQTTIDQLLVLAETTGEDEGISDTPDGPQLPHYNDCQRSPFINEPPPAYTEFPNDQLIDFDTDNQAPQNIASEPAINSSHSQNERSRFWNPPMIGKLPSDFLRLTPEVSNARPVNNQDTTNVDEFLTDRELEQFLEDQRLALYLQNEEFIRQLRRDPDFVTSLEEDHREFMRSQLNLNDTASPLERNLGRDSDLNATSVHHGGAKPRNSTVHQDDTAFRNKLRHMGKSTRKKFSKMAKRFGRKKPQKLGTHGVSTANLLEEEDSDEESNNQTGLEGIEEFQFENATRPDRESEDENAAYKNERRRLPPLPPRSQQTNKTGNDEPIVFYSEDNEFDFKDD